MSLQSFARSRFARNVIAVASGTAGAQAITMIFAPFITRLYGPEAFGLMGVFVSIITVFGVISALTYPSAIVLPKTETDAVGLAKISIIISLVISAIILVFIVFLGDELLDQVGWGSISSYSILIPVAILFTALLQVARQWSIRTKRFSVIAKSAVVLSFLMNSAKLAFGFIAPSALVLILAATFAPLINAFMLILGIRRGKIFGLGAFKQDSAKSKSDLVKEFRDFPVYRAPQVFINTLSQNLPVVLLGSIFGPATAGFYSLSRMVLGMPIQLLGRSIGDVFYPRISEAAHRGENLLALSIKATFALAVAGAVPFGLIIILGPKLFVLIFGSEWLQAGEFSRWLAVWLYSMFITTAISKALPIIKAQRFHLIFTIYKVVVRMLAIIGGYVLFDSALATVISLSVFGTLVNIHFLLHVIYLISRFEKRTKLILT